LAFLGGEALIMLGDERWTGDILGSLRSIGALIKSKEDAT
jgi:hypothetical protein